jgi:hypothetical protein
MLDAGHASERTTLKNPLERQMAYFLYSELEGRIFCGRLNANDTEVQSVSLVCCDDFWHSFVVVPQVPLLRTL